MKYSESNNFMQTQARQKTLGQKRHWVSIELRKEDEAPPTMQPKVTAFQRLELIP